jgi:hypothetical protein
LVALVLATGCVEQSDVTVYTAYLPTLTALKTMFTNPFADGATRIGVVPTPGLGLPLGTTTWGNVSWGKYVIIGNFDENEVGFGQKGIQAQSVGVFDSERRSFCRLDIVTGANATVEWLAVGDRTTSQTRIYFIGFNSGLEVQGATFGYIEGDLANPAPCDPGTGWRVVRFSETDLNNAATVAGLPPERMPCHGICWFDGLAAIDANTVVMNGWGTERIVIAHVDAAGTLSVPDVYPVPPFEPHAGQCIGLLPVGIPVVDPTRPPNDRRFLSHFDFTCGVDSPASTCRGVCPATGAACAVGDANPCALHCAKDAMRACSTTADCDEVIPGTSIVFNSGPCVQACAQTANYCSITTSRNCLVDAHCPAGEKCHACNGGPNGGAPAQEFRVDTTASRSTIVPVSQRFRASANVFVGATMYDTDGALWLTQFPGGPTIYDRRPSGEHAYTDLSAATTIKDCTNFPSTCYVTPDHTIDYTGIALASTPSYLQHDDTMYMLGTSGSLQRARRLPSGWVKDTSFDVPLGRGILPRESGKCSVSGSFCNDVMPCSEGETCRRFVCCTPGISCTTTPCDGSATCPATLTCQEAVGTIGQRELAGGGSPPSLWTIRASKSQSKTPKATYLFRIPVATPVPEGWSAVRPAAAWGAGRLWMVGEHLGVLQYRTRDAGLWSAWSPLPAGLNTVSGPGVVATDYGPIVFATDSLGQVHVTYLTSAPSCAPGACTWTDWVPLPGNVKQVSADVAATLTSGDLYLAFRRVSDSTVYISHVAGLLSYTSWVAVPGVLTDTSPSLTYHPRDGKVWLAVRESGTGTIKVTRIDPATATADGWIPIGTGTPAMGGTAPTIVSDGALIRLFGIEAAPGSTPFQTVNDGVSWAPWRRLIAGENIANRQPAAASANGVTTLLISQPLELVEQAID